MLPFTLLRGMAMERLQPSDLWASALRRRAGGEELERIRRGAGRPQNSRKDPQFFRLPGSRQAAVGPDRQGASRFRRDGPNDRPQPTLAAASGFATLSRNSIWFYLAFPNMPWFSRASRCGIARSLCAESAKNPKCSLFAIRMRAFVCGPSRAPLAIGNEPRNESARIDRVE